MGKGFIPHVEDQGLEGAQGKGSIPWGRERPGAALDKEGLGNLKTGSKLLAGGL